MAVVLIVAADPPGDGREVEEEQIGAVEVKLTVTISEIVNLSLAMSPREVLAEVRRLRRRCGRSHTPQAAAAKQGRAGWYASLPPDGGGEIGNRHRPPLPSTRSGRIRRSGVGEAQADVAGLVAGLDLQENRLHAAIPGGSDLVLYVGGL